ncbi:MAG: 1,4-dihydroxy-6-naphthoate synthase [Chitinophagaceae bacterium]|jgi:1,4-dihydroxy-6-naphthoate synthase|nr:1,4-dihydroxy-6-naphthoate synthase [Chitinophagaceae bacterium]MBK7680686.1 1,4-dihydroxy-6-naphthoate synthase [Chitinophagaceae bacterium]MBK8300511.1 1,4-dihydroxy-6-naphthoate synthase [Chitinophagaceae bacterium]MBK9465018.1 1,4-dihydroxy-6-naphthoate synthase [Chitinophagaceae bacterium]MBK9660249.1 1,4-dihydroxy-6-naphthoate synthase [Chitinophagaceae bacterium]
MKLTLGFSPCPNDTFIFDALVNKKIDTDGLEFEAVLADVETLNQWALEGKLDITKLSFPAFFKSLNNYTLLNAGSALGKGVGPLLITDSQQEITDDEINQASIALPGANTTANLLFTFAYPDARDKTFMLFSAIENALVNKETDLGVIIHENRFTYQQKGLKKVRDLGEYWEQKMELPLPLGGIAINQSVKRSLALRVNELIRKSLEFAFKNYPAIPEYVKQHSQEMSEDVMRQHIDLYVNNYSLDLGDEGRQAIEALHELFLELNNEEADDEDVLFL